MTNKEGGLLMKERTIELIDCRARTSLAMTQGWWICNDAGVICSQ